MLDESCSTQPARLADGFGPGKAALFEQMLEIHPMLTDCSIQRIGSPVFDCEIRLMLFNWYDVNDYTPK
jgi:hypothetical protein